MSVRAADAGDCGSNAGPLWVKCGAVALKRAKRAGKRDISPRLRGPGPDRGSSAALFAVLDPRSRKQVLAAGCKSWQNGTFFRRWRVRTRFDPRSGLCAAGFPASRRQNGDPRVILRQASSLRGGNRDRGRASCCYPGRDSAAPGPVPKQESGADRAEHGTVRGDGLLLTPCGARWRFWSSPPSSPGRGRRSPR